VIVARRLKSDTAPPAIAMPDAPADDFVAQGWYETGTRVRSNEFRILCRAPGSETGVDPAHLLALLRDFSSGVHIQAFSMKAAERIRALHVDQPMQFMSAGTGKSHLVQRYVLELVRSRLGALTDPAPYVALLDAVEETAPEHLVGFEQYSAPNWDGFDATAITPQTLSYARKLMRILPSQLGEPDAAPAADGSIALQWIPDDRKHPLEKLFLDIGPGEEWRAYWTMKDGSKGRQPGTLVNDNTKIILEQLFRKLSK
jgi:hypothetical protein